ncbi:MAG TPA: hypothetical protein VLV49_04770 [Terriglobales bacterium]|nr:hypothetical protein [Terriglobales bacterium]
MKRTRRVIILAAAVLALMLWAAPQSASQDEHEVITVKSAESNNGVVIVRAEANKVAFELQCNQQMLSCTSLHPGQYVMVRLPKNWGIYICANVNIYQMAEDSTALGDPVGQYCVIEK